LSFVQNAGLEGIENFDFAGRAKGKILLYI